MSADTRMRVERHSEVQRTVTPHVLRHTVFPRPALRSLSAACSQMLTCKTCRELGNLLVVAPAREKLDPSLPTSALIRRRKPPID